MVNSIAQMAEAKTLTWSGLNEQQKRYLKYLGLS